MKTLRILSVLCLLFMSSQSWAAVVNVSSTYGLIATPPVLNALPGQLVIATVEGASTSGVTISGGPSWLTAVSHSGPGGGRAIFYAWTGSSTYSGTTITFGNTTAALIDVYSGSTSTGIDATAGSFTQSAGTSLNASTVTVPTTGDYVCMSILTNVGTASAGTGYTVNGGAANTEVSELSNSSFSATSNVTPTATVSAGTSYYIAYSITAAPSSNHWLTLLGCGT